MNLELKVQQLTRWVDAATEWLGKMLAWLCLLMMLVTCLVVAMRYLFQSGNIIFVQETVTYLHSAVFLLASGWTLKHQGHVRVDLFYRNFSTRTKAWIDALGTLIFLLPICVLIFFSSLDFVGLSWSIRETSGDAGGVPLVYLLKTMIPLMALVLAVQGVAELVRNVLFLCGIAAPESEGMPEFHL